MGNISHSSRLFPSGYLDEGGRLPIPTIEAAKAVDRIYPAKARIRQSIERFVCGESLDIITLCALANVAYALADNDAGARMAFVQMRAEKDVTMDERKETVLRFVSADGFRHLLARAVCGADQGKHVDELANLLIVLEDGNKMIAEAIMRAMTKGRAKVA